MCTFFTARCQGPPRPILFACANSKVCGNEFIFVVPATGPEVHVLHHVGFAERLPGERGDYRVPPRSIRAGETGLVILDVDVDRVSGRLIPNARHRILAPTPAGVLKTRADPGVPLLSRPAVTFGFVLARVVGLRDQPAHTHVSCCKYRGTFLCSTSKSGLELDEQFPVSPSRIAQVFLDPREVVQVLAGSSDFQLYTICTPSMSDRGSVPRAGQVRRSRQRDNPRRCGGEIPARVAKEGHKKTRALRGVL